MDNYLERHNDLLNVKKNKIKEEFLLIKSYFIDKLKEKGLVKIIFNLKQQFEDAHIINGFDSDWRYILSSAEIDDDFIVRNRFRVNWYLIQQSNHLTGQMLFDCRDSIKDYEWTLMLESRKFSETLLRRLEPTWNQEQWRTILTKQGVSAKFVKDFEHRFYCIDAEYEKPTSCDYTGEMILCKHADEMTLYEHNYDWRFIYSNIAIDDEFFIRNVKSVNWILFDSYREIPEIVLRKYYKNIKHHEWCILFCNPRAGDIYSEDFLEYCSDYWTPCEWYYISYFQTLSNEFREKYNLFKIDSSTYY